jgi:microfibrillar-associated protein 1
MADRKGDNSVFSRDEMNALLGGSLGMIETSASNVASTIPQFHRVDTNGLQRQDEVDVSSLTVAQTAARLKQADIEKQQRAKLQNSGKPIVRAQRNQPTLSNRHVLLQEQLLAQKQEAFSGSRDEGIPSNDSSSEESEVDDALERSKVTNQRKRGIGSVVVRTRIEPQVIKRNHERHRKYSSDESNEDSSSHSPQRQIRSKQSDDDTSTNSDDSEEDRRRQRLLAKRRQLQNQSNQCLEESIKQEAKIQSNGASHYLPQSTIIGDVESPNIQKDDSPNRHQKSDSEHDSSSASSSTSSSDNSSSEEDDANQPVLAKPLFVPRHQRKTILSHDELKAKENESEERKRVEEINRQMESRNLVAQVVASTAFRRNITAMEDITEEGEGASISINLRPDDTDPTDPEELEMEREAWEVRELERLLQEQDKLLQDEQDRREYLRRRAMTDEERLREDQALGLYQKPGGAGQRDASLIDNNSKPMVPTRYFHRGAYYMDETEWTEDDIRHKAKDYERGITEEDKYDKRKLPKIMQVKHFGIARRSTKYKGLAQEDTTDKHQTYLSLHQSRKRYRGSEN